VPSQLAARIRPHCQFVFLRSKVCLPLLSASPRGYALRFGYAYPHRLRRAPLSPLDTAHAGHTRTGVPPVTQSAAPHGAARLRAISNSAIAVATDTLSDSTFPRIGIVTRKSAVFAISSRTPRPSEPTTIASRRDVSSSYIEVSPPGVSAATQ